MRYFCVSLEAVIRLVWQDTKVNPVGSSNDNIFFKSHFLCIYLQKNAIQFMINYPHPERWRGGWSKAS